jgi:hypothetical protein
MASRRWMDWDIIAKMGGGLIMVALPVSSWFGGGFITRGLWTLGIFGVVIFFWGLLSIGDLKNDWE